MREAETARFRGSSQIIRFFMARLNINIQSCIILTSEVIGHKMERNWQVLKSPNPLTSASQACKRLSSFVLNGLSVLKGAMVQFSQTSSIRVFLFFIRKMIFGCLEISQYPSPLQNAPLQVSNRATPPALFKCLGWSQGRNRPKCVH